MVDVVFVGSDKKYEALESAAEDVADYVCNNRALIFVLSDILRTSAPWEYQEASQRLSQWGKARFGIERSKAKNLVQKVQHAFTVCTSDYEKNKVRGLIPEKMAFSLLNRKYYELNQQNGQAYTIGAGCIVRINGKDIIYECKKPYENADDSDKGKITVDVGTWDTIFGEFGEVKASPHRFHTGDVKYLRVLAEALSRHKADYIIHLISTQAHSTIQSKLEERQLWQAEEFSLIGSDNFFELLNRNCVFKNPGA